MLNNYFMMSFIRIMAKLKAYCDKVIFWPQYGPTCWFNALLIAVFYSQHSRNMLYKKSVEWDKSIEFFKILRFVLKHKYLKSKTPEKDFKFFDMMRPESILQMVHKMKPKYATENMGTHGAWASDMITKIYKLLQIECLMFEIQDQKLYYAKHNHLILLKKTETTKFKALEKVKTRQFIQNKVNRLKTPAVIIINIDDQKRRNGVFYSRNRHYELPVTDKNKDLLTLNNHIFYNGEEYVLDSTIITNWNIGKPKKDGSHMSGHQIAGITCDNERYVYNGWTRRTNDIGMRVVDKNGNWRPCEFMKFNWDIKTDTEFCINSKTCKLPKASQFDRERQMCFSFAKGVKTLVYVKKNHVSMHLEQSNADIADYQSYGNYQSQAYKPCPIQTIRNPATHRCIKEETAIQKNLIKAKPEPKPCPVGKIRNPLTGRCIKDPNFIDNQKPCPPGKIRNPKTGRCVKDPKLSKKKPCPEGKIRNKTTGRCIKSPYQKALEARDKKMAKMLVK